MSVKIIALISGGGTNMQAIVNACLSGKIDGEVVAVGADNPDAKGLIWAQEKGIPTFVADYAEIKKGRNVTFAELQDPIFRKVVEKTRDDPEFDWLRDERSVSWRMKAEDSLLHEMMKFDFDLVVLAGFMRLVTPYFINKINADPSKPRIMNIHPALLPAFPGTDGYGDTFHHGCKVGGCTVHFIDYGEDTGPIIGQRAISIMPGESLDDFKKRGLEEEWKLFPECIQLFAEDRLCIVDNGKGRKIVKISE